GQRNEGTARRELKWTPLISAGLELLLDRCLFTAVPIIQTKAVDTEDTGEAQRTQGDRLFGVRGQVNAARTTRSSVSAVFPLCPLCLRLWPAMAVMITSPSSS